MNLIDSQGRFLGRISLVDALVVLFLALSFGPLPVFAYRVTKPREAKVRTVIPEEIVPSAPFHVNGTDFTRRSQIRIGDRLAYTEYYGADLLVGYVPAGMDPGNYPVSVMKPDGSAATWGGTVKIVKPPVRSGVPVVMTVVFEDLQPEEADYLERCFQLQSKAFQEGSQPRLLRILKRGPMASFRRELPEETRKEEGRELILADVLILSDEEEWDGVKRYFYQGQPLLMERVELEFGHRTYSGLIHRWPQPKPDLAEERTTS